MSVRARRLKINSKGFYVAGLRRTRQALLVSVSANILLITAICIVHAMENEPDYYATSGETPPIQLTSLARPNDTPQALLENEANEEDVVREIPN